MERGKKEGKEERGKEKRRKKKGEGGKRRFSYDPLLLLPLSPLPCPGCGSNTGGRGKKKKKKKRGKKGEKRGLDISILSLSNSFLLTPDLAPDRTPGRKRTNGRK